MKRELTDPRNPYLTDAARYRLSAEEAARWKRERERSREATRLARHVAYVKLGGSPGEITADRLEPTGKTCSDDDASRMIMEKEAPPSEAKDVPEVDYLDRLRVAFKSSRRQPSRKAMRSTETIESLSLRVWQLEKQLEDQAATKNDLGQRVKELTELVEQLRVRFESEVVTPVKAAVTPPAGDTPEQTTPVQSCDDNHARDDDVSIDLKWTLDAAHRVLEEDVIADQRSEALDVAIKHIQWRPSTNTKRLW